ncbi:cupin domain-containing protein [Opitutus terrae]|uniref:Cupin 2 conserved barrel domain protein n=1 Tax=Opitutus terrae (strain DSM 11246 / JCM 15787 / PB90-1) TaxID=452637 RepID=B1ZVV7_OPITP|nr:hypothetical protein [Opitutus terrae]ACB75043.1 hypothetical protein Oter_1759 [Opitutus terrae PB90-1]
MNQDFPISPTSTSPTRRLLQQDGVTATLSLLGPGDTLPENEKSTQDHVLFVIEGSANVQLDELNFLLKKDQALYVASGKSEAIRNASDSWLKLLRLDLPAREPAAAPIFTVADSSVFASDMSGR